MVFRPLRHQDASHKEQTHTFIYMNINSFMNRIFLAFCGWFRSPSIHSFSFLLIVLKKYTSKYIYTTSRFLSRAVFCFSCNVTSSGAYVCAYRGHIIRPISYLEAVQRWAGLKANDSRVLSVRVVYIQ